MAGITVTRDELSGILSMPITSERMANVDAAARRLMRSVYRGDISAADGYTADVLDSVYTSIVLRLLTNPTGARSLGLASANVTFGGPDEDFSNVATLTPAERADLRRLQGSSRPSFVRYAEPELTVTLMDPVPAEGV